MGLCEKRWPGENDLYSNDYTVILLGVEEHQRGVTDELEKTANCVSKFFLKVID